MSEFYNVFVLESHLISLVWVYFSKKKKDKLMTWYDIMWIYIGKVIIYVPQTTIPFTNTFFYFNLASNSVVI